jgi:hypothetical protein
VDIGACAEASQPPLSKAQSEQLKRAMANNRRARAVLARMQHQTLKIVLKKVPGVIKRK